MGRNGSGREQLARIKQDGNGDLHVSFKNGYISVVEHDSPMWVGVMSALDEIRSFAEPSPEKMQAAALVPRRGSPAAVVAKILQDDVDAALGSLNQAVGRQREAQGR